MPRPPFSTWIPNSRTILTGEAAETLVQPCGRPAPGPIEGMWTPTEADIDALEELLAAEIRSHNGSTSPFEYYRQYAGFSAGGRRMIYMNGTRYFVVREPTTAFPYDWRTQARMSCGGGDVNIGVEYDVEARTFANYATNGTIPPTSP